MDFVDKHKLIVWSCITGAGVAAFLYYSKNQWKNDEKKHKNDSWSDDDSEDEEFVLNGSHQQTNSNSSPVSSNKESTNKDVPASPSLLYKSSPPQEPKTEHNNGKKKYMRPPPLERVIHSSKSTLNLQIRDQKPKAIVKFDDVRGMEQREEAIHFILPEPLTVAVLGAGYKGGQPIAGVEGGPQAIRDGGLNEALHKLGWEVVDHGNLNFESFDKDPPTKNGIKNPRHVGSATRKIFETVYKNAMEGHLCLTLGGDHSLAIGSISAVARAWEDLCVVWVDAHGDINTPETSPSGNLHGMPAAYLLGLIKEVNSLPEFEWFKPCITPDRLVYIGLRDVDFGEKRILRSLGIKVFSMTEVDKYGIGTVMNMALDHVNPNRTRPIHLSYDVDAIDPHVCPATGTRVRGGMSYREARHICEAVSETGRLVGMDIVEVNPAIGSYQDVKETASVAVDLAKSALGLKLW